MSYLSLDIGLEKLITQSVNLTLWSLSWLNIKNICYDLTNLLKLNLDFKMNLGEQNDILKVIRSPNLERRSNLGLLVIPVILLPVILDAFKRSNKTLVIFDLNDHITSLLPYGLSENKLFETLIDKFTNFSLWLVLPIFLITFAESLEKRENFLKI